MAVVLRGPRAWLLSWFPVFESPAFRLQWLSSTIGALGMTMLWLVEGWLVLTITDSAFWVGAMAGIRGAGQLGFGAVSGVLTDRLGDRRMVTIVQVVRAALSLAIGLLVLTDSITLPALLIAALGFGILESAYLPAMNGLGYSTVSQSRLLNGHAARLTAMNVTRIVGSALGGALIAGPGIGWCYMVVAASYLLCPIPLLWMRIAAATRGQRRSFWTDIGEGVRYALRTRAISALLLLSVLMEAFGFASGVLLPVMARDVLRLDAAQYGILSAAWGVGALIATLVVARLGDVREMGRLIVVTAGLAGVSTFVFALSPWYLASLVLSAGMGGGLMAYDATMAALLQIISSDEMRGRVMGLYGLTFGFTPMGGFALGALASVAGAPVAVGLGGVIIMAWIGGSQGFIRRLGRRADARSQPETGR